MNILGFYWIRGCLFWGTPDGDPLGPALSSTAWYILWIHVCHGNIYHQQKPQFWIRINLPYDWILWVWSTKGFINMIHMMQPTNMMDTNYTLEGTLEKSTRIVHRTITQSLGIPGSWNEGTVLYKAIFWGYIPLHSRYIGVLYGRYLQ